ncbi:MAG: hypothetical protein H6983_14800 [Ectothiorhodospiraceae bacterium]|nr:hypothetical protein [Chromatiales bacterium]MCP5155436.1 hypothetical protein [Ectothiorhodospiraceae bacterium]
MSIAVAVRKDGQISLVTDSQTNMGSERVPPENFADTKRCTIGDAHVAATGWSLYSNILDDVLSRRRRLPRLDDELSIFKFFNELWKILHDDYSFVKDQSGEGDSPFGSLDSSFLIASPRGLFSVSSDLSVTRYQRYFAIGSGAPVALGAVHALYDGDGDAETVASRAAQAAIAHDIYCGPPLNVITVRERAGRAPRDASPTRRRAASAAPAKRR